MVDPVHVVKFVESGQIPIAPECHVEIVVEAMILRENRLQVYHRQRNDRSSRADTEVVDRLAGTLAAENQSIDAVDEQFSGFTDFIRVVIHEAVGLAIDTFLKGNMGCTRHTVRKPLICRRSERSNMTRRHKCAIRSGRLCLYVKKTCICCCVVRSGKPPMGAYPHPPILRIAIGRVLLRANSLCSQLGGPSFEHFPFTRNWMRPPLSISLLLAIHGIQSHSSPLETS